MQIRMDNVIMFFLLISKLFLVLLEKWNMAFNIPFGVTY